MTFDPRMPFDPNRYVASHPDEVRKEVNVDFASMTEEQLRPLVDKLAKSNAERLAEAIAQADWFSWMTVHREYFQTAENKQILSHYLKGQEITYASIEEAYRMCASNLELDDAPQDQPKSYKGYYSGKTYGSIDDLINGERAAVIQQKAQATITDEEIAFEQLPLDDVKALIRTGEQLAQQKAKTPAIIDAADAFRQLRPEYADTKRNAQLMKAQLAKNGLPNGTDDVQEYERAFLQLRESGLLDFNQRVLASQHKADVKQLAEDARPAVFDATTEDQMYNLPLEELRRRAEGNFTGVTR